MSDNLSVELTEDGSPTVYSQNFEAHYHSMHGALQESQHVFIDSGISFYYSKTGKKNISILEYGMGTGLNVLLSWKVAEQLKIKIHYHTLEGFPIPPKTYDKIKFFQANSPYSVQEIHRLAWNKEHQISNYFTLMKEEVMFENYKMVDTFDIIYFDAFAPSCQPTLWQEKILCMAHNSLKPGGILVTFCAQGAFKRILKSLGCQIERLPGPPGKREMTRATKDVEILY